MKEKTDVDPKSIDLKEAYCMCSHAREYFAPENEGKQLTYKSNSFPLVIDKLSHTKITFIYGVI